MNGILPTTTPLDWGGAVPPNAGAADPEKIRETAIQFESLLIGQMLSSMRQAEGAGWLGCGEDQAGSTMTEMAEQCVAQSLAARGGFGLAPMIIQGLTQQAGRGGAEAAAPRSADQPQALRRGAEPTS
jgi:Rod binding domain-containing protein